MVISISPSFQSFSNYFKSAWDLLTNHHHHNSSIKHQLFENNSISKNNNIKSDKINTNNYIYNNTMIIDDNSNNNNNNNSNSDDSIVEFSYDVNNNNNNNNNDIIFEEFTNDNIIIDNSISNNNSNNNNNNDSNNNLRNEIITEEIELLSFIDSNKEVLESNYYIYRVLSWLLQHDPFYIMNNDNHDVHQLIHHSIECTKNILELHEVPLTVLPIAIQYADNFVKRCGINSKQIVNLLISSAIVSVKFWSESICVDHRILGRYFGLSNKDLCYMERLFLNGINYELYTNKNQIIEFINSIENEKQTFVLDGQTLQ